MEINYRKRVRVNVSTSVKGIKTWDATIEMVDTEIEEILIESDRLTQQLEIRYPVLIENK